tara:strand:- start:1669 stop:2499 length:831 start_codon:yes stop_codon:yes gene_type:complete
MENEGDFLGVDFSRSQPRLIEEPAGFGHNSEAGIIARINYALDNLDKVREGHVKDLQSFVDRQEEATNAFVGNQEEEEEVFLAILGNTLLEGRKLHKGHKGFNKFCCNNFPNLLQQINRMEMAALLWAAEFPEQRQEMSEKYPRVKTTRGAHAKMKEDKKAVKAKGESKPPKGGGTGGGKGRKPNTDPIVHTIDFIANCFLGVRANMRMYEIVNETGGISDYELSRAITLEIHKQYGEAKTEGILLELKDLALQLSRAVEITLTETNDNVVSINSK